MTTFKRFLGLMLLLSVGASPVWGASHYRIQTPGGELWEIQESSVGENSIITITNDSVEIFKIFEESGRIGANQFCDESGNCVSLADLRTTFDLTPGNGINEESGKKFLVKTDDVTLENAEGSDKLQVLDGGITTAKIVNETIVYEDLASALFVTSIDEADGDEVWPTETAVVNYVIARQAALVGDNLGNQIMTQNLQTDGNWIKNDGDATAEGIFIATDGNVGIGQSDPDTILDIDGAITLHAQNDPSAPANGNSAIWLASGAGTGSAGDIYTKITDSGGTTKTIKLFDFATGIQPGDNLGDHTATKNVVLGNNKIVGGSTPGGSDGATISASGDLTFAGSFTSASDVRLKTDINPLKGSLEKILTLRGVRYRWRDKDRGDKAEIGVIAQEVKRVYPELVGRLPEGYLAVNYQGLVAPLIEAVKTLAQYFDDLTDDINREEANLKDYQRQIEELVSKL